MARRRREWDDWGGYERTSPIRVEGGIRAQAKRGQFGESWWAKRWVEVLESFDLGGRLTRGRSYARAGQVLGIEIGTGTVAARVQGSRSTPYEVTIQVRTLSQEEWRRAAEALAGQALYAAKLLAGEMPHEIEDVLAQAGVSLFPARQQDLTTDCSCPDWSNPCKHIAAVYYLLGEEFDRDPFLLFRMRGMGREEFLKTLGPAAPAPEAAPVMPSEPLAADAGSFWQGAPMPADVLGDVHLPPVHAALVRRLGSLPFWRGERPLLEVVAPIYADASQIGLEVAAGEWRPKPEENAGTPGRQAGVRSASRRPPG